MSAASLTIGEPGALISLVPREGESIAGWPALLAFEAGALKGEFAIELIPGAGPDRWSGDVIESFSNQLEHMHGNLSGDAHLHALEDELRVHLHCTDRGRLEGNVQINLLSSGDPRNARIVFQVNLDQSYLPQMISAVRANFPGL